MKRPKTHGTPATPALAPLALALGVALSALPSAQADAVHKLSLPAGNASCISIPAHKPRVWRGAVASVSGTTITLETALLLPDFLVRRDGDGNPDPANGYAQYIAILRWDASATPASVPPTGNAGDWWYIDSNTPTTITVDAGLQGPSVSLGAGDRIEIVPLTSLRDVFGGPGGAFPTILNKDNNGAGDPTEEDVINYTDGTSFSDDIFYYPGGGGLPEGYVVNGNGPFTGEFLTLGPDQALFFWRLAGTPNVVATAAGKMHRTPVTHYFESQLGAGAAPWGTSFGTAFPIDAGILASGLQDAGIVYDSNGGSNPTEEDVLYRVQGTSFSADYMYHDGSLTGGVPVWVEAGNPNDLAPIVSGVGHFFFRMPNLAPVLFRQAVPMPL